MRASGGRTSSNGWSSARMRIRHAAPSSSASGRRRAPQLPGGSRVGVTLQALARWLSLAGFVLGFGVPLAAALSGGMTERLWRLVSVGVVLMVVAEPVALLGQTTTLAPSRAFDPGLAARCAADELRAHRGTAPRRSAWVVGPGRRRPPGRDRVHCGRSLRSVQSSPLFTRTRRTGSPGSARLPVAPARGSACCGVRSVARLRARRDPRRPGTSARTPRDDGGAPSRPHRKRPRVRPSRARSPTSYTRVTESRSPSSSRSSRSPSRSARRRGAEPSSQPGWPRSPLPPSSSPCYPRCEIVDRTRMSCSRSRPSQEGSRASPFRDLRAMCDPHSGIAHLRQQNYDGRPPAVDEHAVERCAQADRERP